MNNNQQQQQQQLPLSYMNTNNSITHSLMAYSPTNNVKRGSRSQDRLMPIANVIRIMRKVLPAHAKIADDAKESIQECVSEFISFVTSEANDRCQREQRKTITAEDVLWAMSKLGFDDYYGPLCLYLQRYREIEGDQKGSIRGEPLPVPLSMLKKDPSLAISTSIYNNESSIVTTSTYQNGGSRTNGGLCNPSLAYYTDMSNGTSMPVGSYSQYKI